MNEIIKIKCPFDGAVLSVRNVPGIENKTVTCPVCKNKYPFAQFRRVVENDYQNSSTEYPGMNRGPQNGYNDSATEIPNTNYNIGCLKRMDTGEVFKLREGKNIVGRKSPKSIAAFQIDTGSNRILSRNHIIIDVCSLPGSGCIHNVSLYKEEVNKTYLNGEQIYWGDKLVLKNGDIIKLPGVELSFIIQDEDSTRI